jgi:Restriction endonuclease NaeI
MRQIRRLRLDPTHPDYPVTSVIRDELMSRAGGFEIFRRRFPALIRQSIDEVIDTPRTGRVFASELEKTEKTYIGTKVEIIVRSFFRLPKGILDLKIAGLDVDVKNTLLNNWMIPPEAVGNPCILIASDEAKRTCFFGIFIAHPMNLTSASNRDKKLSVSAAGFANIDWLLAEEPFPEGFWPELGKEATVRIMRGLSGNERIVALFQEVLMRPIHRDIVQDVAQQKDYMKRLRKNGGARDTLAAKGIALLSGKYDGLLITELGLPQCGPDEFISYQPSRPDHISRLRGLQKIDPV